MTDPQPEPPDRLAGGQHDAQDTAIDPRPVSKSERSGAHHDVVDLAAIEHELAAVEAALPRLDDGTYWTDEVTGDPIPDSVLANDPIARRA